MNTTVDWDVYAKHYDALLELTPYREMLDTVTQKATGAKGQKILDASCGTGNFILKHYQTSDDSTYYGLDYSLPMLRRAQAKCFNVSNCSFLQANLDLELPFVDGEFDLVVSINTLYAVASPEATLREFRRVLKPGGKLLLVNPTESFENGLILKEHCRDTGPDEFWMNAHSSPERERMLLEKAIPDESVLGAMLWIAYHNRLIAQSHHFHFFRAGELEQTLMTSGFQIQSTELVYAKQDLFITAN